MPAFFVVRFGQAVPLVYHVAILNVRSSSGPEHRVHMAFRATHFWTAVGMILLIVLQYRLWFDDSGVFASRQLEHQIHQLRDENAEQQSINDELMSDVINLRSGDELLEETARENLGLVKDGETFILFADPSETEPAND